jgi:hypothetical protein
MNDIAEWLSPATPAKKRPVSTGTLKNYRDGRRAMPPHMRKLLARQLRKHARRLERAADALDRLG